MRFFRRKIYSKMQEWKHKRDGSTALLIKGARRVGKFTIAFGYYFAHPFSEGLGRVVTAEG